MLLRKEQFKIEHKKNIFRFVNESVCCTCALQADQQDGAGCFLLCYVISWLSATNLQVTCMASLSIVYTSTGFLATEIARTDCAGSEADGSLGGGII